MDVNKIMQSLEQRNPGEKEYLQAVHEVLESIVDVYNQNPHFKTANIIERLIEPDRVLSFKVPWMDDQGNVHVNRGYRIQFNNAIGPYKGGLRFHPSVNLSILKFLGFEQIFKNALTTLPMGGAKGGSDFQPKGKSNNEIMRFCQSYMLELWRIIGPDTDVPAGDIGVGAREIGFLYGMYKKLTHNHVGVLTGKGINWGGSLIRPEATGFGAVYFAQEMLNTRKESLEGKKVAISGFGNVAWGAAIKLNQLGAKVVTISGPDGYIYDEAGISGEKIEYMLELRASNEDIVEPYATEFKGSQFIPNKHPWEVKCDIAMPCATQNELDKTDAQNLVKNGCKCVCEGANMPCTPEAIEIIQGNKMLYAPGKASNAGGVATSGLEMTQNAMKLNWGKEEVDSRLNSIMKAIHQTSMHYGKRPDGYVDYVRGANIAGFLKVANSMIDQGIV
ncbi:MAG: NADP-specific glutamate dehydrogenase [Bacteroidota bacterium]|nr:MAG: NADP-specific glutamate dehydrogenase [Bacteroidota bacterium]